MFEEREVTEQKKLDAFEKMIAKSKKEGKRLIVAYYADWCGACRAQWPKIEEIAQMTGDKCTFVKVLHPAVCVWQVRTIIC